MKRLFAIPLLTLAISSFGCGSGHWGVTGKDAGPDVMGPDVGKPDVETPVDAFPEDVVDTGKDALEVPPDIVPGDEGAFSPDTGPDTVSPQVISAFSSDGKGVTIRFSEPLDPIGAQEPDNYMIKASDNSQIAVTGAVSSDVFVTLTLDPKSVVNPALTYEVWVSGVTDLAGNTVDPKAKKAKIKSSAYVALVWHQHQPFYVDVAKDELTGPWVRKHATKDYYDMAAILAGYPDVHVTINLTAVLMTQLLTYYIERLGPYVDVQADTVDEAGFLAQWRGRTDPWIDLLLDDTPDPAGIVAPPPTDRQIELFYNAPWSCLSTSDAIMSFFPEYVALRERAPITYTHDDLLLLKVLFEIAWFDPDFLNGPVPMPDGSVVDLSDVVNKDAAGRFTLVSAPTEDLANRLVAENYKVMKNVVAIHEALSFDPRACAEHGDCQGQIELTTTPFYHPILPLLQDTDLAAAGMPYDTLPKPPYSYPGDAHAQVAKAVRFHKDLFGAPPLGMWPGEGSVAEQVVGHFADNDVLWIATDQQVLARSLDQMGQAKPPCYQCRPWRVDDDASGREVAIVFRDTGLSNKIGFTFQPMYGQAAAQEFMKDISAMAPPFGSKDPRLITVILDGENAWEMYTKEHDAKGFFHALYKALSDGALLGEVVPVTPGEYLLGNPGRNVPAHPVHGLPKLEPLWAGSWIDGTFSTWIGEPEENEAWEYLAQTRAALAASGLARPDPMADPPSDENSVEFEVWRAWEEMYAAEGSDWFWWYGDDMTSPANDDTPFDMAFRSHLGGMYAAMNAALVLNGQAAVAVPDFPPLIQAKAKAPSGPFTVAPVIDGQVTPTESWASEGGLFFDNDSGAMANPLDDVASVYFGYGADAFYVAIVFNGDVTQKSGSGFGVSLYFSQKHITNPATGDFTQDPFNVKDRYGEDLMFVTGGASREVRADFGTNPATVAVYQADGAGNWNPAVASVQTGGPLSGGKYMEFKVPFATLGIEDGDPLEFAVVTGDGSGQRDRAPNLTGKLVFEDVTNLVFVTFELDATGAATALDTYGPINNPPPPAGKGIAYIAGNQDKLAQWVPNKVALRDDGQAPDAEAGDNIWTATFGFMPGTLLRYKYTIGIPLNEGKWTGTEEFPLTERGFDVTKDPSCKKMHIHDIFADRPQPTGTAGPNSTLDACVQ
ncbi:MAG: hypothetical protein GXP54_07875 [Deltaproteobacteria bacterium]|nr:hypothetical protein [Deltaproteobacteria bacterium]